MRNLPHFYDESFSFFHDVVKSKHKKRDDPGFLDRLETYYEDIDILFEEYNKLFKENKLHTVIASTVEDQQKSDLLDLYHYDNKRIQALKTLVTTIDDNRALNTCQNCTVRIVESMDHQVPKNDFPEFSVHPLNLFPSCEKCNKKKGKYWRTETGRLFLNLYLDPLPEAQYLFCNVSVEDEKVEAHFELRNNECISTELFQLLKSHYDRLELCSLFSLSCGTVISRMATYIKNHSDMLSIEQMQSITLKSNQDEKNIYGQNHWEFILQDTLITSEDFINFALTNHIQVAD
ncbi:MAG: hypothetical protein NXI10_03515 [bacterium]|nr:hypothetical protein [bacterium]